MLKAPKLKSIPYGTKADKATAKVLLDYLEGKRPDLPGFTRRVRIAPEQVKRTRKTLNLTQKGLADLIQVQLITVQSWEQGQRVPDNTAAALLLLLEKHKAVKGWLESLWKPKAA